MEINRNDHLTIYDGLPTRKKLEMLAINNGLPTEIHGFINDLKQQFTVSEIYQKCKPLFAHEYALSKLKSEGFLTAVCSNSVRNTVELMLEKAMILKYFDALFSNEDVKKVKPDPEMYVSCMKKLGVEPQETLILEDNENGIKAAKASGAHLLEIQSVHDVTYFKIKERIAEIENSK